MRFLRLERTELPESLPFVMALAGWGDAAGVASQAVARLAEDGVVVATFDADELFDFRSNRPMLHFADGELRSVRWPRIEILEVEVAGRSLLVGRGHEPDFRWRAVGEDLVAFAGLAEIDRFVTLGAVPAPVPHTRPVRVVATASDPGLLATGDELLPNELVVPAAALSVFRKTLADAGIPTVGYWAQVPHYVGEPYHAGQLALLEHLSRQLELDIPVGSVAAAATQQREELDRIVASRDDARAYVARLEAIVDRDEPRSAFEPPDGDDLVAEIERFLRESSQDGEG
ncbi:MAG TPA: PAC2 family protein [Actinobacteria bacterium]|nr:PAC2 family protein [Actinomycetota bacterium]